MPKFSRDKGNRREREFITLCKDSGIHAERVPLSGASHYQGRSHDIDVYRIGRDAPYCGEVKARKDGDGFKTLYKWLDDNDFLALKRDGAEWLIVMPMPVFRELMKQ